ncbi:MAG: hypothetical protein IPK76_02915 [Lewinellaceae bacterium]|nr:hypothetical protein [Lewinellaceae bacterium]
MLFIVFGFYLKLIYFFSPIIDWSPKGKTTYLRKPNPAIAIYDDPRSKHWIERSA